MNLQGTGLKPQRSSHTALINDVKTKIMIIIVFCAIIMSIEKEIMQ